MSSVALQNLADAQSLRVAQRRKVNHENETDIWLNSRRRNRGA